MKAMVYQNYGGPEVLREIEIAKPQPGPKEILIRVVATSVTTADWRLRALHLPKGFNILGRMLFGMRAPKQKILGTELAGVIETVGPQVTRFKEGDEVILQAGAAMGCYVEYKVVAESAVLVRKPAAVSFVEAATFSFGFSTAWNYLCQRSVLKSGQKILIYGASGSVGSAAVQIAKFCGAEVTAVCSAKSAEYIRSLGADHVLDYQSLDSRLPSAEYDIAMDVVGQLSFLNGRRSLKKNGTFLMVSGDLPNILRGVIYNMFGGKKYAFGPVTEDQHVLEKLVTLLEQSKIRCPIDRVFSFKDIKEAHAYVEQRRRRGNIAIQIGNQ